MITILDWSVKHWYVARRPAIPAPKPGRCVHRDVRPVIAADEDEPCAWLCRCGEQLPANWGSTQGGPVTTPDDSDNQLIRGLKALGEEGEVTEQAMARFRAGMVRMRTGPGYAACIRGLAAEAGDEGEL